MDYTKQAFGFKLRKSLRYVRLYGFGRTLAKIRSQYHMQRQYNVLPVVADRALPGGHVGLIGCGNFAYSTIAYYLRKQYGPVIRACMDVDIHRAASLCETYRMKYYTADAAEIIQDPHIDLIYIASNHASHAEYAIEALNAGKSVHIEKPHVVRKDQLKRLCAAMRDSSGRVNLGFNRPRSALSEKIKRTLVAQKGPALFNWHIVGHTIPQDHWYYAPEEGGRALGNLCHWTDYLLWLVAPEDRYPLTIQSTRTPENSSDMVVNVTFGDGSMAVIAFSVKGYPFEGVREHFFAHKGEVMISMDDFDSLVIEKGASREKTKPFFRDHGHQQNIMDSYQMVRPSEAAQARGCSIDYVWETGNLFLRTQEALEKDCRIIIPSGEPEFGT